MKKTTTLRTTLTTLLFGAVLAAAPGCRATVHGKATTTTTGDGTGVPHEETPEERDHRTAEETPPVEPVEPVEPKQPEVVVVLTEPTTPIRPSGGTWAIVPTSGPVGTSVTIYGDLATAATTRNTVVKITFEGGKPAAAEDLQSDHFSVTVPKNAKTGKVVVTVNKKAVWTGEFAVVAADDGLIKPSAKGKGLLGAVYKLPENTARLPNFAELGAPFTTIVLPNLDVAPRSFTAGFPALGGGKESLLEWFAIRFTGKLTAGKDATLYFQLNSDDGARLWIDGKLVVDNDGVHPPTAVDGAAKLTAGPHDVVVEYFQGPREEIALQLNWRTDDAADWLAIPADAFTRE